MIFALLKYCLGNKVDIKFARAVMYVLHEALGLSEEKMIAPMDEKRGKLLLAEILNGGNFGRKYSVKAVLCA